MTVELLDLTGRTWQDSDINRVWRCVVCACGSEFDHGVCHDIAVHRGYFGPIMVERT